MNCPVCSYTATRHFDHQREYWFCNHCWQEIPEYKHILARQALSRMLRKDSLVEQLQSQMSHRPVIAVTGS